MDASRFGSALLVPLLALAAGCASSDQAPAPLAAKSAFEDHQDPVFVDQAVNVDRAFSDGVDASDPNKLVVPIAGNETMIARIKPGSIVAGDRDSKASDIAKSKNPYGFLRKVIGVEAKGGSTILTTEPAQLDEWIQSGDLVYSDRRSLFTTAPSLHVQADSDTGAGSGSGTASMDAEVDGDTQPNVAIAPIIQLKSSRMDVNAQLDGYFKVRTTLEIPRKVEFKSLLTIDPVISSDLVVGVSAASTIGDKTVDLPTIVIPIAAPIPLTVRLHPRLKCSLNAAGSVSATVNATLRSHAAVGFEGSGSLDGIATHDLSEAPTLEPTFRFKSGQIQAGLTAQCQLLAVPEVLAFDAIGLSGEIGPYVTLTANACLEGNVATTSASGGFTLTEQHGLQLDFNAHAQLPVIGIGKDFPLLNQQAVQSKPLYLVGDQNTCTVVDKDTCSGRTDGFYCSVENAFGGIYCEGGQVLQGLQCDPAQKCVGGTRTEIRCN